MAPNRLWDSRSRIPAAIATELERLNPQQIILLGSSGAVSDSVRAALETYDRGGGVVRIGGANRFETAAMISGYTEIKDFTAALQQ